MDTQSIIGTIVAGQRDDDLDALSAAIDRRKAFVNESRLLSAKAGDIVTLSTDIRPAYLAGRKARVNTITRGKRNSLALAVSMVDGRVGRFSENITIYPSHVAKVERPDV